MNSIPSIHNKLERECTEYVTQYINLWVDLYKMPTQQLMNYRRDKSELLFVQPPYLTNDGNVHYNDLSILSKIRNIDIRYEFASLDPKNSTLRGKALLHALDTNNIPEKMVVLVLIGDGYSNVVEYTLRTLIKTNKLPVMVLTSIEEYKRHIDHIFTRKIEIPQKRKHSYVTLS